MKIADEIHILYWLNLVKKQTFNGWVNENEGWIEIHANFGTIVQSCLRFLKKYVIK